MLVLRNNYVIHGINVLSHSSLRSDV